MFQSSLEENPEWNARVLVARVGDLQFQSSLEENPEWNSWFLAIFSRKFSFNPHSRKTPSGTGGNLILRSRRESFNPHSRKTPSGTLHSPLPDFPLPVSILTRGKPRVERDRVCSSPKLGFQSSLEENPEWNLIKLEAELSLERVSILTRGKPRVEREMHCKYLVRIGVSILTRGKPRVEPAGGALTPLEKTGFNPHSRKTPSGTSRFQRSR